MKTFLFKDFDKENQTAIHIFHSTNHPIRSNPAIFRVHTHDYIEIVYVTAGSALELVNDERYEVRRGDLLFINYGATHAFQPHEPFSYINICFKPESLAENVITPENAFAVLQLTAIDELRRESDDSMISADFYGEIPEAFLTGYAAMEACFDILTAEMPEYVAVPMEMGEIADSDRAALNTILENMTLEGPADSYAITGFAKDEYFATSLGLSSDEGVASGLNFAPMMMSVAYSLNIVTLEEGADVNAVAEDFENNIDWLRWVCVQPSDVLIATQGNQVLCLLGADAFYQMTATAIEAAGWTTYSTLQNPNM